MRFGLCCLFKHEKISFRTTTAKALLAMNRREQLLGATRIFAGSMTSVSAFILTSLSYYPPRKDRLLNRAKFC